MSAKNIEFSDAFMRKYGKIVHNTLDRKWIFKTVLYWLDWRNVRKMSNIRDWLKDQVDYPDPAIIELADKWRTYSDDLKIIYILRWVNRNIRYISDSKKYMGINEVWQLASQTFRDKTGDCEDGACLIYVLAKLLDIPDNRLRFTAGLVFDGSKFIGHAYITYKPNVTTTEADRNLVSNIHSGGTTVTEAVEKIVELLNRIYAEKKSGVSLGY